MLPHQPRHLLRWLIFNVRQKMKHLCAVVVLAVMLLVVSCSEPPRFLFLNRSGHDIVVELPKRARTIANGQFVELKFDPAMVISVANERRVYSWRYPLPVEEYVEYGRSSGRFAFSLESDGKIYARKIVGGSPSETIPIQPAGFPLSFGG